VLDGFDTPALFKATAYTDVPAVALTFTGELVQVTNTAWDFAETI